MKTMSLEIRTKCLNLRAAALGNGLSGRITETKKILTFSEMPLYTGTSWNTALASVPQTDPSSPQLLISYDREENDFYSDG